MTISRVNTAGPVTDPAASLSDSVTLAGDAFILLCVTARGGSGSPGAIALGTGGAQCTLANGKITIAGGLFSVSGSARFGRIYQISRANNPGAGAQTITVTWAGQDHIGVSLLEYRADGELSVTASVEANNASTPITLTLSALTGDVTVAACMGNSAAPAFTPTSGQTELLESAWFLNTGHVVGELAGASSSIAWTASGSTCGGAVVLHEASSGLTATGVTAPGALTLGATASVDVAGAGVSALGAVSLGSTAALDVSAAGVAALGGLTLSSAATLILAAAGVAGPGALGLSATGALGVAGAGITDPAALGLSATGTLAVQAEGVTAPGAVDLEATASTEYPPREASGVSAPGAVTLQAEAALAIQAEGVTAPDPLAGTIAVFTPGPASRTRTPGPGVSRLHVPARGPNRVHVAAAGRSRTRLV